MCKTKKAGGRRKNGWMAEKGLDDQEGVEANRIVRGPGKN